MPSLGSPSSAALGSRWLAGVIRVYFSGFVFGFWGRWVFFCFGFLSRAMAIIRGFFYVFSLGVWEEWVLFGVGFLSYAKAPVVLTLDPGKPLFCLWLPLIFIDFGF